MALLTSVITGGQQRFTISEVEDDRHQLSLLHQVSYDESSNG